VASVHLATHPPTVNYAAAAISFRRPRIGAHGGGRLR
jgi:hypothetical protein